MKAPVRATGVSAVGTRGKNTRRILYVGAGNHTGASHVNGVDEKGNVVRRKMIESWAEEVRNAKACREKPVNVVTFHREMLE